MSVLSAAEMNDVAGKLISAIQGGDVEAVRACYTADARVWHNFDEKDQTIDENLATLGWLSKRLTNRRYEILARRPFDGGYVQQHVLTGTLASGATFRMPACIVVQVRDGKIARLEEYLDTAQAAALRAK